MGSLCQRRVERNGAAWSSAAGSRRARADAVVQEGDPQSQAPWLVISLTNQATAPRMSEIDTWTEIKLAIPGVRPGDTGPYKRVWGTLWVGDQQFDGNAEYLRRDVIGLPEVQASGEFSILLDGSCRTRAGVQRMRQ